MSSKHDQSPSKSLSSDSSFGESVKAGNSKARAAIFESAGHAVAPPPVYIWSAVPHTNGLDYGLQIYHLWEEYTEKQTGDYYARSRYNGTQLKLT